MTSTTKAMRAAAASKNASGQKSRAGAKGIEIKGDGKYPLVPLDSITIVERPEDGDESSQIFFNPRGVNSFDAERMENLRHSIRTEGLQSPPMIRAIEDGSIVTRTELIAGERRIRVLNHIVQNDLPCMDDESTKPAKFKVGVVVVFRGRFGTVNGQTGSMVNIQFNDEQGQQALDCEFEDVYPTRPGSEVFKFIPCRVHYQCSDKRALKLAFEENEQHEPLPIADEIALVRRLIKAGFSQEEIAQTIGKNVTWVSQTANFELQLPAEAYSDLINGRMARNVAVNLMSYAEADRLRLYKAAQAAAKADSAVKISEADQERIVAEDLQDLHAAEARTAERNGDKATAEREKKKAATAAGKVKKATQRLSRARTESGQIKQGHIQKAATENSVVPRKCKTLQREEILELYVKPLLAFSTGDGVDPVTGEKVPLALAGVARRVAQCIVEGERDPLKPIRDFQISNGLWDDPEAKGDEDLAISDDDDREFVPDELEESFA